MAKRFTRAIRTSRTTSTGTSASPISCRWDQKADEFWISAAFTSCTRFSLANAGAGAEIPMQLASHARQWCILHTNAVPILPVRGTDGDIARIPAGSALDFGIADRDQRARLRNHIEVRDAFGLRISVVHEPGFAFQVGGCVGIQRFVPMHQDVALFVQELQRFQSHSRKTCFIRQPRIRPALRPIRADEYDRALRNAPVPAFPTTDIG